MTTDEFLRFFKAMNDKKYDTCVAKNQDYSGSSEDPFRNFKAVEDMGICSAETGILVRIVDKIMRINNIIKSGKQAVLDESVQDTCLDGSNYFMLLAGLIESRKPKPKSTVSCVDERTGQVTTHEL